MRKLTPTFPARILALAAALMTCSAAEAADLEAGFRDPPHSAGIRAFWWWLNGNVTKEAITRDLEEMKAKGFNGALIFDADGSSQRGNARSPPGRSSAARNGPSCSCTPARRPSGSTSS